MTTVELELPDDSVDEIEQLAARLRVPPGDALLMGVAALELYLSVTERGGLVGVTYPDGRESILKLT